MSPGPMKLRLTSILLFACGGSTPPAEEPAPEPTRPPQTEVSVEAPDDARSLGDAATFGDLVAAARTLDEQGGADAEPSCLLRRSPAGWRIEGDLSVALRPLPDPPEGFASRMGEGSMRVLSRWGQVGSGRLAVAAFTGAPPPSRGALAVVFVGDEGIWLRTTEGEVPVEHAGPFTHAQIAPHLEVVLEQADVQLYVTAEAEVSLTLLAEVLAEVPEEVADRVVLGVLLDDGVALPSPPPPGRADVGMCATGLPPTETAEGELAPSQILEALPDFRRATGLCLGEASAEAARGGRMVVTFRVVEGGTVGEACAVEDALDDSGLRTCVLDALRAVRFPDPGGYVDAMLPLDLAPDRSGTQRALCPTSGS